MRRFLAAVVVLVVVGGWSLAGAQTIPTLPTLPPVPEPAGQVIEVLGPTFTPVCGTTAAVGFLGPAALATAPPEAKAIVAQIGPTLAFVCGAVPVESGGYVCQTDRDISDLVVNGVGSVDGSAAAIVLTVFPSLMRAVMNQMRNLVGLTPAAPTLEPAVAGVLQCQLPAADPELPDAPTDDEPQDVPDRTPATFPVPDDSDSVLFLAPPSAPLVPVSGPVETVGPAPTEVALSPSTSVVHTYGFQYAAVLLVPLALLVGAAFAGGALTRELRPKESPDA